MFLIYADKSVTGYAVVKKIDNLSKKILLFFVSVKYQGKGVGRTALKIIEHFSRYKNFQIGSPTGNLQLCFYVNKCGYKIIRV